MNILEMLIMEALLEELELLMLMEELIDTIECTDCPIEGACPICR